MADRASATLRPNTDGRIDAVAAPPDELQSLLNPNPDAVPRSVARPEVTDSPAETAAVAQTAATESLAQTRTLAAPAVKARPAARPQRPVLTAILLFIGAIVLCLLGYLAMSV